MHASDDVFDRLAAAIFRGEYPAASALPSEAHSSIRAGNNHGSHCAFSTYHPALLAAGCLPRAEDLKQEKHLCNGSVVNLEQMRSSCTALIQSGRLNSDDLAWAYSRRGQANILLHQPARAIQDYTEEIRLTPNDADGFMMRAIVETRLGNSAGAKADFAKACALDPERSCGF